MLQQEFIKLFIKKYTEHGGVLSGMDATLPV